MANENQPRTAIDELTQLAQARFGKESLSGAELELLKKVPIGEFALRGPSDNDADAQDDPNDADRWGPERRIRAEVVSWLCMDHDARKHIHWRGIRVNGADITGSVALSCVDIPFALALQKCRIKENIDLSRSQVSELDLQGSLVHGITADGVIVKSDVLLRYGFTANDEVRLPGANIGGDLDCGGGKFADPRHKDPIGGGTALNVDGIDIKGSVFLRNGFTANGEVRLVGAQINGDFSCGGGTFTNPPLEGDPESGKALSANRIHVKGAVSLNNGFVAEGEVLFVSARIEGELRLEKSNFNRSTLDLTGASASTLRDGEAKWPPPGKLNLDGFVYGLISTPRRIDVARRLEWLALQPTTPFRPRPYLQLAKIVRESGDTDGSKRVLEKMEELRRSDETHTFQAKLWSRILKWTIGYGYYPQRAILALLLLSVLGWGIYCTSYRARAMVPTDKDAYEKLMDGKPLPPQYPRFSPLVYSVENTIPLVKFGQADKWQPNPSTHILIWFLRIQILLGWLLATFFLAGVSGIVHKE